MLRVSIAGSDQSYSGIYETDNTTEAAALALADLVENFGFFGGNTICRKLPPRFKPEAGAFGFLVMPDDDIEDPDELEYLVGNDSTAWVYVIPAELNKMVCD